MRSIRSCEQFEGEFSLPGDKSITHRAVMLNSMAEGEAVITNALCGEDCMATCSCMRALGAKIDLDGDTVAETDVKNVEFYMAGYLATNGAVSYLNASDSFLSPDVVSYNMCNSME